MKKLALLCDMATDKGGAERYWATVIPKLLERYDVQLYARVVQDGSPLGIAAQHIPWSNEDDPPSAPAAAQVEEALRAADLVVSANVLDSLALQAVRRSGVRWTIRLHDHRAFCPNGNKVFPQLPGVCTYRMGAPCVASTVVHGCVCGPRPSSLRRIADRLRVRDEIARANAIMVAGTYMQDLAEQNGVSRSRLAISPPPLDDEFFNAVPAGMGCGVLYAGRIEEEKGLHSLVRALGLIERERRPALTVAGRGSESYERAVRAAAGKAGVNVTWLGFLQQRELRDAIDRARIFALPSLWPEPFGLSGTQALVRNRPVVAYDVGGVRGWLRDAGSVVPRGDERRLASAIESLCNDEEMWACAASYARQEAQQYRLDAHIERFIEIVDPG